MASGVDIVTGIDVNKRPGIVDWNQSSRLNLSIALVHYPVVDKNGHTDTSAVTNLDLHDIARAAKTYGVGKFYVVTPLAEQKELVQRILEHWIAGYGATYNPRRKAALALVKLVDSLAAVRDEMAGDTGIGNHSLDTVGTLFLNWGMANDRLQFNSNVNWWFEREFGVWLLWVDWRPQIFKGDFLITPKLILMHGETPYAGDFGLMRGASEAVLELRYEF